MRLMILFHGGAEVFDVTMPFRPNGLPQPAHLSISSDVDLLSEAAPWLVNDDVQPRHTDWLSAGSNGNPDYQTHMNLLATDVLMIEKTNRLIIESGLHDSGCLPLKLVVDTGVPARVLLVGYP